MTFFGCQFGFWKCFGASSWSNHWASCHQLSYKIHLSLQVSNRWRNNSSLVHRIRDCDTSKQQFFDLQSAREHPLIELFHLSNLLQMLNDHRIVDADFYGNFLCSCKRISFDDALHWSLISFWWLVIMLMFKALVSFEKFLCESPLHCTFISSFWAKCAADVASCLRCFTTHFELE